MAKTKKAGRKIVNRATKGCGKCKRKTCSKCKSAGVKKCNHVKCMHNVMRGGCTTCSGGQVGGDVGIVNNVSNLSSGISGMILNVFRGFQGQPPSPLVSF